MNTTIPHPVVSHEEWLAARTALLAKEKELTRQRDALCEELRALPWEKVEKDYVFEGPDGDVKLSELFGKNSQLIVYHFMFDPDWDEGCDGCSFISDHVDSARMHFEHRDVSYVAVSRAPIAKLMAFKKRMEWKFPWVSSGKNSFNYDYNVSFTDEQVKDGEAFYNYKKVDEGGESPGVSVFAKDEEGNIFHTYSTYSRGMELALGTFVWMDVTPKGRNEDSIMNWVRHHDRYDESSGKGCCCH